jgi:hypothetical protein
MGLHHIEKCLPRKGNTEVNWHPTRMGENLCQLFSNRKYWEYTEISKNWIPKEQIINQLMGKWSEQTHLKRNSNDWLYKKIINIFSHQRNTNQNYILWFHLIPVWMIIINNTKKSGWAQWLTYVIPASREVDITVQGKPWQKKKLVRPYLNQ